MTDESTKAIDYGYLLLFWVFANVIRGAMLLILYPFCSAQDTVRRLLNVYSCAGELRGAVGLALALAAGSNVHRAHHLRW